MTGRATERLPATVEEAAALLANATRDELQDHAFGDCEVYWMAGDVEVACGYFGIDERSVTFRLGDYQVTFAGADADRLRSCGNRGRVERNDSAGRDAHPDYDPGQCISCSNAIRPGDGYCIYCLSKEYGDGD